MARREGEHEGAGQIAVHLDLARDLAALSQVHPVEVDEAHLDVAGSGRLRRHDATQVQPRCGGDGASSRHGSAFVQRTVPSCCIG